MNDKVPQARRRCTVYWWCSGGHDNPDGPHTKNLDLIEHLDNRDCLIEVNLRSAGGISAVQVFFTDLDLSDTHVELDPEVAGLIGYIIRTFDRRGTLQFGDLLYEGFQRLQPSQIGELPLSRPTPQDIDEAWDELTDEQQANVVAYFRERYPLATRRAIDSVLRDPQ